MEKLELKHLAPYLPYDLKVKWGNDTVGLQKTDKINVDLYCTIKTHVKEGLYNTSMNNIKPILRPLSDLTKEIEIDGEKFVPIVELARSNHVLRDDEFEISNIIHKDTYCYIDYFDNSFDSQHRFYYDFTGKTFQCGKIDPNEHNSIRNGLELFEKLFEWHFDTFNLIEKGLAIDINTLNK